MAIDKHSRDPGIKEIVDYFDQPEHSAWHLLTDSEAKVLHAEIKRCSEDFRYIARNYYQITTKDGSDTFLRFKETQEMCWEVIRWLRLRGRGVKMLIVKGRQLLVSTLVAAYMGYLAQFNPNNRGLVVSYDERHAGVLFGVILHIYDQLPWWLRPMIGMRKYEEGIHLINPDPKLRRLEPGLNSRILVQGATQTVGIAEGETINSAHLSEIGSWDTAKARKIIVSDFRWALPDHPSTTAILETRVRQASKFVERLWESSVELGEVADWHPLFIPIYFDKSHFVPPPAGWQPEKPELAVKERAAEEWVICPQCGQIRPAHFGGASMVGIACRDCQTNAYVPYTLQDGQMLWLMERRQNAERMGEKALTEIQQSLATNPQEAFANVTETVFSQQAREWVAQTTRDNCLAQGYIGTDRIFHGPRREKYPHTEAKGEPYGKESKQCWAQGCKEDHTVENNRYLKIWQFPIRGAKYALSADVAAGYGRQHDYSTIIISRLSTLPNPDIQVASYRCNTISAWHFADLIDSLGRYYNNALVIVDYTNYQTTGDRLHNYFNYPNLYRWMHADAIQQYSNRWHWMWNNKNKEAGWTVLDGWLRDHSFVIKDPILAKEIRHFQRLEDGSLGAPDSKDDEGLGDDFEKIHDDMVTAAIQLIIAAHQQDPRRPADVGNPQQEGLRGPGSWFGICAKCKHQFEAHAPQERDKCPFCGSVWMSWKMREEKGPPLGFEFNEMSGAPGIVQDRYGKSEDISFGNTQTPWDERM